MTAIPPPQQGNLSIADATTTTQTLTVNSDGTINAKPSDGAKTTYAASQLLFTPAATPTDVFTITGSATKAVRITRIEVTGLATTAGTVDVALVMRSTANSGGTSTGSPSAIPYDSNSAAASATVLAYTANPTLGTAIGAATTGYIRAQRAFLNVAATGASEHINFDFGNRPSQAVVLRGITQVLAVNLNGNTLPTGTKLSISVEWTEE